MKRSRTCAWICSLAMSAALIVACAPQQAPATPTKPAESKPAAAETKPTAAAPKPAEATKPAAAPAATAAPGAQAAKPADQAPQGVLTVADDLGTESWLLRTSTGETPLWYIGEPLVWWDWEKDQPTNAAILESWESTPGPDGSVEWIFKIKKGVKFHKNQGEVTAEDVKFTFTEFLKEGSVNANTQIIRDIFGSDPNNLTVVDPYTLKIRSPKPLNTVEMFRVLSAEEGRTLRPFPKKYFEQVGEEEFARNPVYAGPYEFVSQTPGYEVRLKAVPDHYRAKPAFAEIRYLKVQDDATRVAMLRSGQLDMTPIPGRLAAELKAAGVRIEVSENAVEPFIALGGMFPSREKFDPSVPWVGQDPLSENSIKVRQALNLAVDRKAIVDKILFGYGQEGIMSFSFIGPGNPWWNSQWQPIPYDVDKAKQLLAEAGYPGCFEINMWLIQNQTYSPDVGEAVASMWEKNLGCKVNRRLGEYRPTLRTMIAERDTANWTYSFQGSPIARPQRYACLHGGPKYQVLTHTELPYYTDLCSISDKTLDLNELVNIERQIGDMQYKYFPTVAVATAHQTFGVGPKVGEWKPMPKKPNLGLLEYAKPK